VSRWGAQAECGAAAPAAPAFGDAEVAVSQDAEAAAMRRRGTTTVASHHRSSPPFASSGDVRSLSV
jgi:hypothetical protein